MRCRRFSPLVLPAAIFVLASGIGGCGDRVPADSAPPSGQQTGPRRGGTAVLGYTADMEGVNPVANSSTQPTTDVVQRIFLNLLEEQPDFQDHPPTFTPRLAESYEWSDDHKILTFNLRRDAVWSDGHPITAEDVRFTWQAQVHPAIAWDNATMKSQILDVEVADEHTARFHFARAYPGQLVQANEGVILPAHAWGRLPFAEWRTNGAWFVDHLVTSGPFLLESWKPQEEIVLERNDLYYEKDLPYLDRVVLRIIPDPSAQLTRFLSGSLDYVRQVPAAMAAQIDANPKVKLVTFWPLNYNMVLWNNADPRFSSTAVRRALTLSIDRQTIVDTLWYGYARTATSPILSELWGHNDKLVALPYDPAQARKILAAEGWADADGDGVLDRGGERFAFELITNAGNQERIDAAVMIQEQLRKVGIEAQPRTLDFKTIGDMVTTHRFEACIMALTVETSLDLSPYFHTNAIDNELNFGSYRDPEVDRLLEDIRAQISIEDAKPLLDRMQEILHRDQPQTMLWESQRLVGLSSRVEGAKPNAISTLANLREWWLAPTGGAP